MDTTDDNQVVPGQDGIYVAKITRLALDGVGSSLPSHQQPDSAGVPAAQDPKTRPALSKLVSMGESDWQHQGQAPGHQVASPQASGDLLGGTDDLLSMFKDTTQPVVPTVPHTTGAGEARPAGSMVPPQPQGPPMMGGHGHASQFTNHPSQARQPQPQQGQVLWSQQQPTHQ
ncbi:unnamed protein product, partial [Chrysoparadoxa australica]